MGRGSVAPKCPVNMTAPRGPGWSTLSGMAAGHPDFGVPDFVEDVRCRGRTPIPGIFCASMAGSHALCCRPKRQKRYTVSSKCQAWCLGSRPPHAGTAGLGFRVRPCVSTDPLGAMLRLDCGRSKMSCLARFCARSQTLRAHHVCTHPGGVLDKLLPPGSTGSGVCATGAWGGHPMHWPPCCSEDPRLHAGKDFQVACYDWRMTPFTDVGTDGPHLQRVGVIISCFLSLPFEGCPLLLLGLTRQGCWGVAVHSMCRGRCKFPGSAGR